MCVLLLFSALFIKAVPLTTIHRRRVRRTKMQQTHDVHTFYLHDEINIKI